MMNLRSCLVWGFVTLLGGLGLRADAASYYVSQNGQTPGDFLSWAAAASNIQDAVNAANTNDTVWVGPGRYTAPINAVNYLGTNVVYMNKPMALRGFSGLPADVVIDGGGSNRGIAVLFLNTPTNRYVLDGLTISNCSATVTSAPAIKCYGGGVLFYPASVNNIMTAEVRNCVIVNNTVGPDPGAGTGDRGAGLYLGGGSAGYLVTNCVIRGNRNLIGYYGGIVGVAKTVVHSCVIEGNSAVRGGGGAGVPLYINTRFIGNTATGTGGSDGGGGVMLGGVTFTNCLMYNNRAYYGGGFAWSDRQGSYAFYSCTIVSNRSANGGAVRMDSASDLLTVYGSILCSNVINTATQDFSRVAGSTSYVTCSYFKTNGFPGTALLIGTGNITNGTDPGFVDFAGQNFRLTGSSPCLNRGTNLPWMIGAVDLDGNPRVDPGTGLVDMGCYEHVYPSGTLILTR